MAHEPALPTPRWYRTPGGLLLLGVIAIAGAALLIQFWTSALAALPWLLVLACPLLHVFMHRGHGGHGGHGHGNPAPGPGRDDAGTPKPGA
ncbi:MAG: DUF2933 domain-containing protein [Candidatus Lambdaproteobacteria bacterium]|nr:DUF2933 domain-containing protein [Candidatus Lambdaproteobacteria bacterium]